MDSHGETAHWSLRLVFHTKKRHCLILSIATAAEQHLRFSLVPASGDFPSPGLCSAPARRDTRYNEREGSGAGQGRQRRDTSPGRPREAPAGAPSPPQPPRSRRGRSFRAPARLPAGVRPRPAARRRSARARSHPAAAAAGPGTHRPPGRSCLPLPPLHRPIWRQHPDHFRFRGSGAGHSPGVAPLLDPGSGRGRGAGWGGGRGARSVTGERVRRYRRRGGRCV